MSGEENFVTTYNDLVRELEALGNQEYRPVRRFANRATAEKRCRELGETLEALRSNGPKAGSDAPEEVQNDIDDARDAVQERQEEVAHEAPKKKAGKKKAKPAKEPKAGKDKKPDKPAKPAKAELTEAEHALGVRPGTKKAKLLAYLMEHKKERIARSKLITTVYGKPSEEFSAPFSSCIAGLNKSMQKKSMGSISTEKSKGGKEVHFVFDPKG